MVSAIVPPFFPRTNIFQDSRIGNSKMLTTSIQSRVLSDGWLVLLSKSFEIFQQTSLAGLVMNRIKIQPIVPIGWIW